MPAWLLKIVTFLGQHFGKDIVLLVRDRIVSKYRKVFTSRNVLVLGARQTGKTTLLLYLQHGRPFEPGRDGEAHTADPTAAVAIVDRRVEVDERTFLRLKKDVPGDTALRDTWRATLEEVRPDGIIYMLDGRLDDAALELAVDECFSDVLSLYANGLRELVTLHMFVGHCDRWGDSEARRRTRVAFVRDRFEVQREAVPALEGLRFGVAATQLSPHRQAWLEVDRALGHFGADLRG